jgi:hypothetical protein
MLVSLDQENDLPNQPAAARYLRNGPKNNHRVMERRKKLASQFGRSSEHHWSNPYCVPCYALCRALLRRQTYLAATFAGLRCFGFGGGRYEELFVNPTRLTLARQRGNLDCGFLSPLWKLLPACSRFARRACFRVLGTGFPSLDHANVIVAICESASRPGDNRPTLRQYYETAA